MSAASAARALARGLHGRLIRLGDPGYDAARRVWNGLIDKRPALIAQCADADDVVRAVRAAREHDLLLAVRGGGHNVAGLGTCDGGLVIDLSAMREVAVDPAARTARAQGGATWGDVDRATQAHDLATTGGLITTTGIGGFTLGGGIGWLTRKHGMAVDNLLSVELVTAASDRISASATEHPDLFWAVRGGGGNFGVVTSFTYRLHPVGPMVFGGAVFHPAARARDLLRFYREWVRTLPDELTSAVVFATAPPEPFMPPDLVGTPMVAVPLCWAGPLGEGEAAVRPLRDFAPPAVDLLGPLPYTALQGMFDAGAPKGVLSYWKTEYLSELSDAAIDVLMAHTARMGKPFAQLHVHHVGGAVARAPADATAVGRRDAPFTLNIIGMWQDPAETEAQRGWVRGVAEALRPLATGAQYLNFLGDLEEDRVRAAYGDAKYARLQGIKKRYDPGNLFRVNHNIRPAP
jgi:hypothetical protein